MDADVVLLAGGGAEAYQNAVKALFTKSRIVLPNESVASNVRAFGSAADREEVIVDITRARTVCACSITPSSGMP